MINTDGGDQRNWQDTDDDNDGLLTSAEDANTNGNWSDDFTQDQDPNTIPDYLYDPDTNPLPVALVYFGADVVNKTVLLTWQTATEKNNNYFEIQRSGDGRSFDAIGIVDGAGDSGDLLDYRFVDSSPNVGISYYRLRQVDFDGTEEIFGPRVVSNEFLKSGIDVFLLPNPTTSDNIHFEILTGDENTIIWVRMIDIGGKVVYNRLYDPSTLRVTETLNPFTTLKKGLYFLTVVQGKNERNLKVVIK